MTDIAISVQNLSKCYQIYENPRDRLKQFVIPRMHRIAGKEPKQYFSEFWALKDVSFEIKKGETVGIIGRNGSGKSTLLQMICGTLNPTSGSVQTNGRIAALLELGSGFNPEFTGRENVYMNAAVLGLSADEVDARFDDIAAFADIGQFMEQPVKTYSSGMVVRLAFAVAINVEPEILIVDEALSVGDELFQRKCFSRIESIRANGATILFVSHSASTILELCDRAVLIDSGEMLSEGMPKGVIASYQKLLHAPADKRNFVRLEIASLDKLHEPIDGGYTYKVHAEPGVALEKKSIDDRGDFFDPNLKSLSSINFESHGAIIQEPSIFRVSGEVVNNLKSTITYLYKYKVKFNKAATNVRFAMLIKTTTGVQLGGSVSPSDFKPFEFIDKDSEVDVSFYFKCNLNPDTYYLNAGVVGCLEGEEVILHRIVDAYAFKVLPIENNTSTAFVNFDCKFSAQLSDTKLLNESNC
jgi:lipopolysaccharide transport system ATP-binding protein